MEKSLIIGYGNIDRQDDGVAWHILAALSHRLGRTAPESPEELFAPNGQSPEILFLLQLTPELAETIARYERVCFVDTHTGNIPEKVQLVKVESEYRRSNFTHHMLPETCIALSETLYGKRPEAVLISVRGYHFGFAQGLSPETAILVPKAVDEIMDWLKNRGDG